MKISKSQQQKVDFLLKELSSEEEKRVSEAIGALSNVGNSTVIFPVASCLLQTKSEKNRKEILHFFSSLIDPDVAGTMIKLLQDDDFLAIRQVMLTTIWSGKIDFSAYIAEFVEVAVEGDFVIALDCLTIIEQMSGPFKENHLLEAQLHLKEYLEDGNIKEERHQQFVSEIAQKLKEFIHFEDDGISEYMI